MRSNSAGAADEPVAWKPTVTDAPGARPPFQSMLFAVTAAPDCDQVALQPWLTFWSPGKANPSVQPFSAADPLLVIVTCAVKPPCQLFCTL